MPKATLNTKPAVDPIFAVIEAHRRALAIYEPAANKLNAAAAAGDCEEGDVLHEEHEAAGAVMLPLHMALCEARATTPAGRLTLRAYKQKIDAKYLLENAWTATPAQTRAIRARLRLLAHERPSIPPKEMKEAMKADQRLVDFCVRHEVSGGWLSMGDIRGLLLMTQDYRRSRSFAATRADKSRHHGRCPNPPGLRSAGFALGYAISIGQKQASFGLSAPREWASRVRADV